MNITRIKYYVRHPGKMIMPLGAKGCFNWIPDSLYLRLLYRGQLGEKLDLKNPQKFNEKLQWLKLNDRKEIYHQIVDKQEVKKLVAAEIGEQYIIPTLNIWDKSDDIDIDNLPSRFVLKCTHDSGSVIICLDKGKFNLEAAKQKLNKALHKSTYWFGREWPYYGLKPHIIAESFIGDEQEEVEDYKVMCFHGEPKLIFVHAGRIKGNHTQDVYDTEWKKLDLVQNYATTDRQIAPPEPLEEMLRLSAQLAKDFIHIRVDWYVVKNRLLFGELTFYDGSGLAPFADEKWNYTLGSWIHLPTDSK